MLNASVYAEYISCLDAIRAINSSKSVSSINENTLRNISDNLQRYSDITLENLKVIAENDLVQLHSYFERVNESLKKISVVLEKNNNLMSRQVEQSTIYFTNSELRALTYDRRRILNNWNANLMKVFELQIAIIEDMGDNISTVDLSSMIGFRDQDFENIAGLIDALDNENWFLGTEKNSEAMRIDRRAAEIDQIYHHLAN